MRLAAPSGRSTFEQRRELSRRRRVAAGSLSSAYPAVEQLRIQLDFRDTAGYPPSAQVHDLFPAAPAFFEFTCPYGDCDGTLDLSGPASRLLTTAAAQAEGVVECPGSRAGGASKIPCSLRARYRISARYSPGAG
jgi:hypothetical protein